MLVFLRTDADPAARERVLALFRGEDIRADLRILGGVAVIETPPTGNRLRERAAALPGVERIESSESPAYRLAGSRDRATAVAAGSARFGDGGFAVIAGPCAVESAAVLNEIADAVRAAGAHALRGGAFKPRTSPYTFQGLGEEALRALRDASERTGLPVVTEVMDPRDIPLVSRYADLLQVGSRNMQNFPLLAELGRQPRPVLLKRGMAATLGEFLAAAEYILAGGNGKVVLCERGVRTFGDETRNTLDLAAVPALRARTHLPVIVDPSHATGRADLVRPLARAAAAAGADGVMVEVHVRPDEALCDARQAILPAELEAMIAECQAVRAVLANGAGLVTEAR
ncbi:MAG TPA: 3-deoxy-7-phosphoheptulonate synthase [Planctomycetota bacterium]|nr:3-deoxy-7-phosphoheptulonate synthase [Planctomycetota bacterium]